MAARSARSQAPVILDEILLNVIGMFRLHDLSMQQSTALKSFVSGSDTFVSLPTGHGKSLIYQLAIPLMKQLSLSKRSNELSFRVPSHPMLLVVSPLTALINDQINSCERLGLKCCKLEDFKLGNEVDVLFTSPETLESFYLLLSNLSERIFGVVVDETHCVVTW